MCGAASATDYTLGHGGYYYQAGSLQPYMRTQVYRDGYYYYQHGYRYYSPGYYEYSYSPYYVPVPPALPKPTDANWRTELLKIAAQREEEIAYESAIKLLGINRGPTGYGGYQYQGVVNSTTVYGNSVSDKLNLYNNTDMNTLFQQLAQITDQQQYMAGKSVENFGQLISQEGAQKSRLLEILARAEVAGIVLRSLEQASKTESRFEFKSTPQQMPPATDPQPQVLPQKTTMQDLINAFSDSAVRTCSNCHSDKKRDGGFALSDLNKMDANGKAKVLVRINTNDVATRMPKGQPALSATEKQLWKLVLSN